MSDRPIPSSLRSVGSMTPALPAGVTFGLVVLLQLAGRGEPLDPSLSNRPATDDLGATLYGRHCALCHGEKGRGDGPVADLLAPVPRDFGEGLFRIVRTRNGVPTDEDLVGSIRRGVPGSGMPPYAFLKPTDVTALAHYVRSLAIDGITDDLTLLALRRARNVDRAAVRAQAVARMTPGELIVVEPPPKATAELLERGRVGYLGNCAACHGARGEGKSLPASWSDPSFPWARDFTQGLLVGGASHEDLVRRIVAGMPGGGMPPCRLDDPTLTTAIALYVGELIPDGAEEWLIRTRQSITASRSGEFPTSVDDVKWEGVPPTRIVLAPLAWHEESPTEVSVRATHDGSDIVLRLEWTDRTRDDHAIGGSRFPDGVAVQFSSEEEAPLFGMGAKGHPVNIWHWKAFRPEEIAGIFDLTEPATRTLPPPGGNEPVSDVPFLRPCEGLLSPSTEGSSRRVEGVESPGAMRGEGTEIVATPRWLSGKWSVMLRRSMAARVDGEIDLVPPTETEIAFAVWNGSADDRGARKSISIWHRLIVKP